MLKRLIEVALPLREVSEQSAREKSIRHGHISTLHVWWARKPLAACRAAVFASLIPDPDDPNCPESFRKLVRELLGRREFKPRSDDGSTVEDTLRNRCLEFIKHLVKWENSNNPEYIAPARRMITAAHKFLHSDSESDAPIVLDPFAGGGAIPLESLRLGCETHAIDLNPVAHLIELCTLVYPQRYGKADSRPVPNYIKRLIPLRKGEKRAKRREGGDLFTTDDAPAIADALVPEVEITETEYRKNPLAADVKYWGHWIRGEVQDLLSPLYNTEFKTYSPVTYIWAMTVKCASPDCKATIPLVSQFWLCKKAGRKIAVRMRHDLASREVTFDVVEGSHIEFDPNSGTIQRGKAECPVCRQVSPASYIRKEFLAGRGGQRLMAVARIRSGSTGKSYRSPNPADKAAFDNAVQALKKFRASATDAHIPTEEIQCYERRRVSPPLYGLSKFSDLFNDRQLLTLATVTRLSHQVFERVSVTHDAEYARAVVSLLAMVIDWFVDKGCALARWHTSGEKISGAFNRQALGMVWNYAEVNPLSQVTAGITAGLD